MDIRNTLKETVTKLLMGPLQSDNDGIEVLESKPLDTYLTGILWPVNNQGFGGVLDEDEQESLPVKETNEKVNIDEGVHDEGVQLHNIRRPSSVGLTFHLPQRNTRFVLEVSGALYEYTEGQDIDLNPKHSLNIWKRKPFLFQIKSRDLTRIGDNKVKRFYDTEGNVVEPGFLEVHVRQRVIDEGLTVTATVINRFVAGEDKNLTSLFQVCLTASVNEGDHFCARRQSFKSSDEDRATNALIYRHAREYAVGHGIAAEWEPKEPEQPVKKVYTSWIPEWEITSISPDGHPSLKYLKDREDSVFRASILSVINSKKDTLKQLSEFVKVYQNWVDEQAKHIDKLTPELQDIASEHVDQCRTAADRMQKGVIYLSQNKQAWEAFCLANRAMNDQSNGLNRKPSERRPLVWRPFQLAFFLLTLRSTAEEKDSDRHCMDLLWFPTGGGKTEAYLALAAFSIFYQRLTSSDYKANGSVNVIMRYTLRLLTIQQFQRAAAMICAANQIRIEDEARLGKVPISLGLWVGGGATPNRLFSKYKGDEDTAEFALRKEKNAPPRPSSTPMLLLECPLCGKELKASEYVLSNNPEALDIICSNNGCASKRRPLPVYTVDSEIYRHRPSLIIATVDKFAQLPRNPDTGVLFGKPDGHPPSLIIQDELHLISGPLGTMCGLYETAIDYLCTREGILTKVVGSTATIGRARSQVLSLFNRSVLQFPPAALDSRHSFFAEEDKSKQGRIYVGIPSTGRSPKFTLQAVTASLLQSAKALLDKDPKIKKELDPYWTAALYFNSLRELGGADFMFSDDIPKTMNFYANRLGAEYRSDLYKEELTSRVSSVEIPEKLRTLGVELGSDILSEGKPLDAVLASNMISVGVDISRLGLMIVNGQPKTTAEYIQATSRVGRQKPGIVFVVYNASRPRDLSHFEHFSSYHSALYRSVESTSVTPWSPRARDRALHAVLTAMIRHGVDNMRVETEAINFEPGNDQVREVIETIISRATASYQAPDKDIINRQLETFVQHWKNRATQQSNEHKKLKYFHSPNPFKQNVSHDYLMRSAEEVFEDPMQVIWRVPNSMRSVEPSAWFTLWQ